MQGTLLVTARSELPGDISSPARLARCCYDHFTIRGNVIADKTRSSIADSTVCVLASVLTAPS